MLFLDEPKIKGTTHGPRSFVYAAPHDCNKLPFYIKKNVNLAIFKSRLKTYLFKLAFV